MNLLDLMVKIDAQDNASSKIGGITTTAIAKASAMGQAMYDAVKFGVGKMADGVKAVVGGAIEGYGAYEQLAGGMKKLYGDASDTVINDAQRAYREVGISANQYMQSVAGFSAALKNSLGGDAEEAARLSNTAMKDIADNANTFGKYSVEELTQVYQALAKGQYQTLDNLNLGFGGTKEGMQQLIDKANELRSAHGEEADLAIDSYADIVEAIHEVQKEMDITGTTEHEAMSTIEGSVNSVKAAWQNLLTAFGSGDQKMIQQSVGGIINGIFGEWDDQTQKRKGGVINNLLPVVRNVGDAIIQEIPSIGERIGFQLVQSIMQAMGFDNAEITTFVEDLSAKFEDAKTKITNVFSEVKTAATDFFSSFKGAFKSDEFVNAFEHIKSAAGKAFDFITENADVFGAAFGVAVDVFGAVADAIASVIDVLGPFIPMIASAIGFVSLLAPLGSIIGAISGAVTFLTTVLVPALGMIQSFSGLIAVVTTLLGGPLTIIVAIAGALIGLIATNEDVRNAIMAAWEAIRAKGEELLAWFQTLPDTISGFFSGIGDILHDAGVNIISGLLNGLKEKFEEVKGWVGGIGDWIASHKGPKPYDLKLLTPNGEWIMDSLQRGLENGLPSVQDTLSDITDSIQTGVNASANVSVAQAPSGDAAILNALNAILNAIPDGVYLDKKTLVGNLAPSMNVAMGRL